MQDTCALYMNSSKTVKAVCIQGLHCQVIADNKDAGLLFVPNAEHITAI